MRTFPEVGEVIVEKLRQISMFASRGRIGVVSRRCDIA